MTSEEYDTVIGRLVRLKVWMTREHHAKVDELIESLVDKAEKLGG